MIGFVLLLTCYAKAKTNTNTKEGSTFANANAKRRNARQTQHALVCLFATLPCHLMLPIVECSAEGSGVAHKSHSVRRVPKRTD